jgi:hypothetical protein
MKEAEFKGVQGTRDHVYARCRTWLDSAQFKEIREALKQASATLPADYSIALEISFRIVDDNREEALSLFTTGLETSAGNDPYPTNGDCSVHRYVVNGEICQVPHDRCPNCWGDWEFKLQNPVCQCCGFEMGNQVKLLLDSDICPHCEQGTVTMTQPMCARCGFLVDQHGVTWG